MVPRRQHTFQQSRLLHERPRPGFASFVLHIPDESLTVVVISNIYSSATTSLGYDLAAISLGVPYQKFSPFPPERKLLQTPTPHFNSVPIFYQPMPN